MHTNIESSFSYSNKAGVYSRQSDTHPRKSYFFKNKLFVLNEKESPSTGITANTTVSTISHGTDYGGPPRPYNDNGWTPGGGKPKSKDPGILEICESNPNEGFIKYTTKKELNLPFKELFDSDILAFSNDLAYLFVNNNIKTGKEVSQHIVCVDLEQQKILYNLKINSTSNKDIFSVSNSTFDENGNLIIIGNFYNEPENKKSKTMTMMMMRTKIT